MYYAAQKAGALSNTIILAPHFMNPEDNPRDDEIYWDYSNGWKQGDRSTRDHSIRVSSFEVMDQILYKLVDPGKFPNLKSIVIIGHSAGGQYVQRFACGSQAEKLINIPIRYVSANPSSYLYLDRSRVLEGTIDQFAIPHTSCEEYNEYKYGLEDMNSYMQAVGTDQIREQYGLRDVVYLLGSLDDDQASDDLDTTCSAALQGDNRRERGLIYYNYLRYYYGSHRHMCVVVDGVGHDSYGMFNSPECIDVVFDWEPNTDRSSDPPACGRPDIQIVTQAVDSDTNRVYYSYNSAEQQVFQIKVLVTGPDKFDVRSVHYELHPTFSPPEYTSRDSYNDFELELWTWGAFDMPITVTMKDGRTYEYDYYFTFGDQLRDAQRRGVPFVQVR